VVDHAAELIESTELSLSLLELPAAASMLLRATATAEGFADKLDMGPGPSMIALGAGLVVLLPSLLAVCAGRGAVQRLPTTAAGCGNAGAARRFLLPLPLLPALLAVCRGLTLGKRRGRCPVVAAPPQTGGGGGGDFGYPGCARPPEVQLALLQFDGMELTRLLPGTADEETAPPLTQSQPPTSSFSEAARLLPPGVASVGLTPGDAPAAPKPDPRTRLRDSPPVSAPGNGNRRVDDGKAGSMGRVLMRCRSDSVPALLPLAGCAAAMLALPSVLPWPLLAPLPLGLGPSTGGVGVTVGPAAEPTLLDLRNVYVAAGIREETCLPAHGGGGGGTAATGGPTLVGGGVGSPGPGLRSHESGVAMELLLGCQVATWQGPTAGHLP